MASTRDEKLVEALTSINLKMERLIAQKKVIMALIALVSGGFFAAMKWGLRAELREQLIDAHVIEMKRIP